MSRDALLAFSWAKIAGRTSIIRFFIDGIVNGRFIELSFADVCVSVMLVIVRKLSIALFIITFIMCRVCVFS